MKKPKHCPSFIDPKTGRRFEEHNRPVPGTGKPVWQLTADEFVTAINDRKYRDAVATWFDRIGWPEGWHYCTTESYCRCTGYPCLVQEALRRGEIVPQTLKEAVAKQFAENLAEAESRRKARAADVARSIAAGTRANALPGEEDEGGD